MWKVKVLVFIMFFLAAATIIQAQSEVGSSASTTPYITAYKDEGFHGESEKFLIGEYRKLDDRWKDEIKSVAIVGSVRVTLFDKEQFEGKKLVLEHSAGKLGDLEGEAASMIVEEFKCSYATAYKKTMFEGDSREFRVGDYPDVSDGWDDMQSLDLCGGITATLYTKEGFQGESITLKTGRIDLGKFRKKVKSMKIEASMNE